MQSEYKNQGKEEEKKSEKEKRKFFGFLCYRLGSLKQKST